MLKESNNLFSYDTDISVINFNISVWIHHEELFDHNLHLSTYWREIGYF